MRDTLFSGLPGRTRSRSRSKPGTPFSEASVLRTADRFSDPCSAFLHLGQLQYLRAWSCAESGQKRSKSAGPPRPRGDGTKFARRPALEYSLCPSTPDNIGLQFMQKFLLAEPRRNPRKSHPQLRGRPASADFLTRLSTTSARSHLPRYSIARRDVPFIMCYRVPP